MTQPSPEKRLLLMGAGGHAAVVADSARTSGWSIIGCLDDNPDRAQSAQRAGLHLLGSILDLENVCASLGDNIAIHAAAGSAELRRSWLSLAARLLQPAIIHATAVISPSAVIDAATFIGPGVIINARAYVARGCIINTTAIIEHDCHIAEFSHIAPGSVIGGGACVESNALVGAGAVVLPGVKIGRHATIGAGAVATRDIPPCVVAMGVPARVR